jgi:putative sterol carrier protein
MVIAPGRYSPRALARRQAVAFPFLSDGWIEEARRLQGEFQGQAEAPAVAVKMNLIVTDVPFGEKTRNAHLDTSAGELTVELGHIAQPDVSITLEYETAKAILIFQDSQAGIEAFMSGRIRIEGDMSKLLAFQTAPQDPVHAEVAKRVREITE